MLGDACEGGDQCGVAGNLKLQLKVHLSSQLGQLSLPSLREHTSPQLHTEEALGLSLYLRRGNLHAREERLLARLG